MMGGTSLSSVVAVNITREAARITRLGFGTPMIIGDTYRIYDRVMTYTDPDSMLDDGFEVTDNLYLAAVALMSQELSPEEFKIGRKLANVNSKATITFTGTPSAGTWTISVSIGGATAITTAAITYAADNDAALVEAAIEALTGVTSCTVTGLYSTGYVIEFDGADANADFRVTAVNVASLTGVTAASINMDQYGSAVETWAEAYANVKAEDDDWYFPIFDTKTKADIEALAALVESDMKIGFYRTEDSDVPTSATDDVGSDLQDASYDQAVLIYHGTDVDGYPEAAWVGGQAPKNPGSVNWNFKTLTGVTVDSTLTTTKTGYLLDKYVNYHDSLAGLNVTFGGGVVSSGERIDVIRGCHWLQYNISIGIFEVLCSNDTIPFTVPGLAIFENVIRYWLGKGVDNGFLVAGSQVINMPDLDSISDADKLIGYLNGITFSAQLAGAINKVSIAGKLSV